MRSRVGLRMPLTRTGIGREMLLTDDPAAWVQRWRAEAPADDTGAPAPALQAPMPMMTSSGAFTTTARAATHTTWTRTNRGSAVSQHPSGTLRIHRGGHQRLGNPLTCQRTACGELLPSVQRVAAAISGERGFRPAR